MKCNPLRWLWGLIPLALVWWMSLLGNQSRIQEELSLRAKGVLEQAGLPWASTTFAGRDGFVVGRAEEESEQRRAAIEVAKVWGVRTLEDRTEVLELVKNFTWSATTREGALVLAGYVPNEAARKAVLASARTTFPKHKVDDQLKPARGAPEQKMWLGGTNFALRELAMLKPGGRVALEGSGFVIEGEADSSKSYETVRTALSTTLPQGISLKTDKVTAPAVKPYLWAAALRGRQIELTGFAPSIAIRDQIKAAAERALPGATVVNRLAIGSGAPADWQKAVSTALARLGQLKQGNAELRDSQLTIAGLTETEETAAGIRRSLRSEVPAAFRIDEKITQDPAVKAAEEARRAAELARRQAEEEASKRAAAQAAAQAEARRAAELQRQQAEEQARARAAEEAARRAAEDAARQRTAAEQAAFQRKAAEEAAQRKAEEDARRAADEAARQRVATDEAARRKAADDAKRAADEAARQRLAAEEAARRKAEDDARRAVADADAQRQAEVQRQQADEQARRKAEEDRARVAAAATAAQSAGQLARTVEATRCQSSLTSAVEAGTITFQRASAELDRRSHQTLNALAQIVRSCPTFVVEIAGHTDNEGEPERNKRLSERRARSVLDYLVKAGVQQSSLTAEGYGEDKPIVANDTPANMAKNRRIEFSVKTK